VGFIVKRTNSLIDDPKSYAIIGAAMQVHRVLGFGFLEKVYHEALSIEFVRRQIPFAHEVSIPIFYEAVMLNTHYRADFVCHDSIVVEIKAIDRLGKPEIAQTLNYLKATGYDPALLINFGGKSLEYHRIQNKFNSTTTSSTSAKIP
jgi:GxxExxY protein